MTLAIVKHWRSGAFAATVLLHAATGLAHGGGEGAVAIVTIKSNNDRALVQRLVDEGYDVAGIDREQGTVDITTHAVEESLLLKLRGFAVLNVKDVDPTIAPDANYKTSAEIEQTLRQAANDYPGLTRLESIGRSTDGRDIWALKITDNPDRRELDEPTILFNGMHHAREIMTPEVALDTIDYLLTRYGTDAQVTRWVDGAEIWIVPMLNVDGNNKVWNGSSMWRKNTRAGYGVDINRNYPYAWNTCNGSSGSTSSDTYRGPSAGSEPETQALMALVGRIQPVFSISYHSYSELVIFPYGCEDDRTETRAVVEPIGRAIAARLPRDSGNGNYAAGTSWELLYNVDGGDIDWMYNVHHVIPFVIEVSASAQGFQPAYRWRQPTVEKLRGAWSLLLDKLEGSGVRGLVTDGAGRVQPGATVTAETLSGANRDPAGDTVAWQVKNDGTYHMILNPGVYRLTFTLNGRTVMREVTVADRRVDMDVQL